MNSPAETVWQHTWPWPLWTLIAGGLLFLLFSFGIYRLEPPGMPVISRRLALGLRIAACVVLTWMMFGWLQQRHRTEPADLIVAIDDSASMSFREDQWDSASLNYLRRRFAGKSPFPPSRFEVARSLLEHTQRGWLTRLAERYSIRIVRWADSVRPLPSTSTSLQPTGAERPASRLGLGLREILESQRGRPTAGILLLTDGVTTDGPTVGDTADLARTLGIPLFIVGVGSSKPVRDLRLDSLLADDVAFIGDVVTVSCQLHAAGFARQSATIEVRRTDSDELLAERTVALSADEASIPVRLTFPAKTAGQLPLRISVQPLAGEADRENNVLLHNLTVHDATINVLLAYSYPSYEYRFLKDLLSRLSQSDTAARKAFSLTTILQEADRLHIDQDPAATTVFPVRMEELSRFDVVVFGDVDPLFLGPTASGNLVEFVREHGGGVALIAGPRFMPSAYRGSKLVELFPFVVSATSAPPPESLVQPWPVELTVIGQMMPTCQLLPDPRENLRLWQSLPGLNWRWHIPEPSPAARVLIEQLSSPGTTDLRLPIVMHQYVGSGRVVFHATDETYRWARHDESDASYSRYWVQTIRHLARSRLLRGRSPAEISIDRQQLVQGDDVPIRVRFLREGLAAESAEGVEVVIEPRQGQPRRLALTGSKQHAGVFSGSARGLPSGSYRVWLASPTLADPPDSRAFTISAAAGEQSMGPIHAGDLQAAARLSEGHYYPLTRADQLLQDLPRGQHVRVESLPPQPIWNSHWSAGLFVVLLVAEWFFRKRAGML